MTDLPKIPLILMFAFCLILWSQDRARVQTLLEVEAALKGRMLLEFKSLGTRSWGANHGTQRSFLMGKNVGL